MDELLQRVPYIFSWGLVVLGLALMARSRHLVKQLVGLYFVQTGIILFYMALSHRPGLDAPIMPHGASGAPDPALYVNPLPHVLMLTAIVVGVATQGVAYVLIRRVYRSARSLDSKTTDPWPE